MGNIISSDRKSKRSTGVRDGMSDTGLGKGNQITETTKITKILRDGSLNPVISWYITSLTFSHFLVL